MGKKMMTQSLVDRPAHGFIWHALIVWIMCTMNIYIICVMIFSLLLLVAVASPFQSFLSCPTPSLRLALRWHAKQIPAGYHRGGGNLSIFHARCWNHFPMRTISHYYKLTSTYVVCEFTYFTGVACFSLIPRKSIERVENLLLRLDSRKGAQEKSCV